MYSWNRPPSERGYFSNNRLWKNTKTNFQPASAWPIVWGQDGLRAFLGITDGVPA